MWRREKQCCGMGDRLRLQAGVAMNLGLLAVEAGSRPGSDVGGEPSPDKPRRHHSPGGQPPRMWNIVKWKKMSFLNFCGTMRQKMSVETTPARRWVPDWRKASWERLLAGWNGNRNTRQAFLISPNLERSSFTKMAKMPNCSESCQQLSQSLSSETLCQSICEKKNLRGCQWSPNFCCMTPPIWVSEASVARESSVFGADVGGVPPAAARRRFAFWNASCADAVLSNALPHPPPPPEIISMAQHLCAVGQKTSVNIYHAEETLQLFDILRGWAKFNFNGVSGRGGCPCRRNLAAKNFQRRHCKNTIFKDWWRDHWWPLR